MIELNNHYYHLECQPDRGRFLLYMDGQAPYRIVDAGIQMVYRKGILPHQGLNGAWNVEASREIRIDDSPHGPMQQITLVMKPDEHEMQYELDFALVDEHPLFLWRMRVKNLSRHTVKVDRFELMCTEQLQLAGEDGRRTPERAFFTNGWQSWSFSAAYDGHMPGPRSWLALVEAPMWLNAAALGPYLPGHYRSDFFGVLGDRANRTGLLAGFISQRLQFGQLEARLGDKTHLCLWAAGDGAHLDPGKTMETDWAVLYSFHLDQLEPLAEYFEAVQREHHVSISSAAPAGWCSWYRFYDKVTSQQIQDNLEAITCLKERLPLDLVQIDDGFQSRVGDWFSFRSTFPDGVAGLAQKIKQHGLTPGLWLAPFIIGPKSQVAKQHPEYLLRDAVGQPVYAGYNWGGFTRALDLSNPGALDYACSVVDTAVHQWGYPYLKLDFLYAGALPGIPQDLTRTRAQILRAGMEALRQAAGPETILLGCGAPLGSMIGLVDLMRIGADTGYAWEPRIFGLKHVFKGEPHVPSARNAVQNPLTRAGMHQRWWINDPDCLLVRSDSELTLSEIQSCATVMALTGGSFLLSDDLPEVTPQRLRIAEVLLPLIDRRAYVIDWFDRTVPELVRVDLDGPAGAWQLLARFNWEDRARDLTLRPEDYFLPAEDYLGRSFWDDRVYRLAPGSHLTVQDVPPHGVVLLAVRRFFPEQVQYAGSNLHVSQGLEISRWETDSGCCEFELNLPRLFTGWFDLVIPGRPAAIKLNELEVRALKISDGVYRILVGETAKVSVQVQFTL